MGKNTLTRSLAAGSIVLVLILQGFWLKSSFRDARESFDRQTGFLFRVTIMDLQDSLIRENIAPVPGDSLLWLSDKDADATLRPPLILSRSLVKPEHDSGRTTVTIASREPGLNIGFKNDGDGPVVRYVVLHEADSLRIADMERAYQTALENAGIRIPFEIAKIAPDTFARNDRFLFPPVKGRFSVDRAPETTSVFREDQIRGSVHFRSGSFPDEAGPYPDAAGAVPDEEGAVPGEAGVVPHGPRTMPDDASFREIRPVFLPQTGLVSLQFDQSAVRWLLLLELTPQLLFSLVMLLFIGISFYFIYRSLRMQQRLVLLKNDFVSNMTHELKTPVATASVAIESLRSFQTLNNRARAQEYLEIAQQELNRLNLLTDQILRAAIFESTEVALQTGPVDLKETVSDVLVSMKLVIEKTKADLSFLPEGDDFQVEGDRAHIVHVVYNLLDNALKYSHGKPSITIRLKSLRTGVLLNVHDNGIGIPPEFQQKVFDKFFRVPSGNVHNTKGYGLGLNYVAGIVKRHRGTIRLDSQPGRGTTFIVYLPRRHDKNQSTVY